MLALSALLISASAADADIRPILRQQGFYAPINGRETIRYAGHIRQGQNDYQIYVYRGRWRAAVIDHGGNRLIVIMNSTTLVGFYDASTATRCKVRGQKVVCNSEFPGVVEFTRHGPPYEVLFDGYVEHIAYGSRLKAQHCNNHPCPYLRKWTYPQVGAE